MKRVLPVLAACAALTLAAGCGSSKSSATTSTTGSGRHDRRHRHERDAEGGHRAQREDQLREPPANAPVQSGLVKIKYHEISIEPDTLKVKVGSTIEWSNEDPVEHNVTSASGPTNSRRRTSAKAALQDHVTKPGMIHYRCTLHPATMNGTIEVVS